MFERVVARSEAREEMVAVMMIAPAILSAYHKVAMGGLFNNIIAFAALFCSGLMVILLHYRNMLAVTTDGLIVMDATCTKPAKIPYQDIIDIKMSRGVLEFLTMSHMFRITTKNKTYYLWCIANGPELMELIYNYMKMHLGSKVISDMEEEEEY